MTQGGDVRRTDAPRKGRRSGSRPSLRCLDLQHAAVDGDRPRCTRWPTQASAVA